MRPRDVIEFFNICIEHAEGKARFTKEIVVLAEGEYSRLRFRSLADEWKSQYPELAAFVTGLLSKASSSFALDVLSDKVVEDFCLKFATEKKHADKQGILTELAESVAHSQISADDFRQKLAAILYRVGALGLKISATAGFQWADNGTYGVSPSDLAADCGVAVHPALWRVLGQVPPAQVWTRQGIRTGDVPDGSGRRHNQLCFAMERTDWLGITAPIHRPGTSAVVWVVARGCRRFIPRLKSFGPIEAVAIGRPRVLFDWMASAYKSFLAKRFSAYCQFSPFESSNTPNTQFRVRFYEELELYEYLKPGLASVSLIGSDTVKSSVRIQACPMPPNGSTVYTSQSWPTPTEAPKWLHESEPEMVPKTALCQK